MNERLRRGATRGFRVERTALSALRHEGDGAGDVLSELPGDLTQPGAHWSEYDEWRGCYHRGFVRFVLIERMGIGWIISICAMGASYFLGASITNTFGGVFVKMLSAPLMMLAIGWCQWRALQREFGGQCPPDDSSHSSQRSE